MSLKPTSEISVAGIVYLDPDTSSRIELAPAVISLFHDNRQLRPWHSERGGLLFVDIGANDLALIADASPPHKADRARRASLVMDHKRCLDDIKLRFDHGLRFVGYWHTHPEKHPSLSGDDIYAFSQNLHDRGLGLKQMLAIVVGTSNDQNGLSVNLVSNKRVLRLKRCN